MSVPESTGRRNRSIPARGLAKIRRDIRAWRARGSLARAGGLVVETGVRITGGDHIDLGEGVRLMADCHLWATDRGHLEIGPRTYVGSHSWLVANASVIIGADVLIAPFCYIQDTDHGFSDPTIPIAAQPSVSSPIVIEDGVWLGAHTIVTRGVRIGKGSVLGAGSVVTRDIPAGVVAVGSPARVIGPRDASRQAGGPAAAPEG